MAIAERRRLGSGRSVVSGDSHRVGGAMLIVAVPDLTRPARRFSEVLTGWDCWPLWCSKSPTPRTYSVGCRSACRGCGDPVGVRDTGRISLKLASKRAG
jgi:hypothetical protein